MKKILLMMAISAILGSAYYLSTKSVEKYAEMSRNQELKFERYANLQALILANQDSADVYYALANQNGLKQKDDYGLLKKGDFFKEKADSLQYKLMEVNF